MLNGSASFHFADLFFGSIQVSSFLLSSVLSLFFSLSSLFFPISRRVCVRAHCQSCPSMIAMQGKAMLNAKPSISKDTRGEWQAQHETGDRGD